MMVGIVVVGHFHLREHLPGYPWRTRKMVCQQYINTAGANPAAGCPPPFTQIHTHVFGVGMGRNKYTHFTLGMGRVIPGNTLLPVFTYSL
jgi:hypothetical protein